MRKASRNPTPPKGGPIISVTSIGESAGVPLDGVLIEQDGITGAVERAVQAMHWLADSDRAVVEVALSYARQIDMAMTVAARASEALENLGALPPEEAAELIKVANMAVSQSVKVHYLAPHLHNALKSLGGDPLSRREITQSSGADADTPADPLAAMRAKRNRGA